MKIRAGLVLLAAGVLALVAAPLSAQEHQGHETGHEHMGMEIPEEGLRAEISETLEHSFVHLRHAVARLSDDRLTEGVSYLGREGTIRSFLPLVSGHLGEHLGQSIAYARMNGVVPPWSR